MTKSTLSPSAQATIEKHPIAALLGLVLGIVAFAAINVALASLTVFIGLNLIGGFGLALWQVVGIAFVLASAGAHLRPLLTRAVHWK